LEATASKRGANVARALCSLVALSAILQSAAALWSDSPARPLAVDSPDPLHSAEGLGSTPVAAPQFTDGPTVLAGPLSRVRDGLLEENPDVTVSVLIQLRGEPVSAVILRYREAFGPQDAWPPSVHEAARAALANQDALLERERVHLRSVLDGMGLPTTFARDYRYLVDGVNLRHIPASSIPLLAADPDVVHIGRDHTVHVELSDSVPLINADDVWNLTDAGGRNITGWGAVIANIDTGVDYTHPDLGGTLNRTNDLANLTSGTHTKFVGGWDFVNNDNDPWDDHLHGTHVAGIIGANGTLRGVAPGSKQIPLKVLSGSGDGSDSDVIAAIEYATDPDRDPLTDDAADASSLSLGSWEPYPDALGPRAADASTALGTLCVIAAGNSGPDLSTVISPGISRQSITVGSSTKGDLLSGFSSRGPTLYFDLKPDLVAPGSAIVSAANGGTGGNRTLSGTSMATPHVSGVVALLRQAHPTWGVDEVKSALVDRAKDLGYGVFEQGGGRVDAQAAQNTSVVSIPHKLAMGRLSRAANQTNATLQFKNVAGSSVTLTLSARDVFGMYPDMTATVNGTDLDYVSVVPATITLAPGEQLGVTVIFAPPPTAVAGHYWGSVNATSSGSVVSVPFAYYVRAPVVLVDDDSSDRAGTTAPFDNFAAYPDSAHNLSLSLDRLNITHDIITTAHYDSDGPGLRELLNYPIVVWDVGYDYGYSDATHTHFTLSARDRQALSAYLDAGGQLWLLGESIAWDLYAGANTTVPGADFLNAYMGVARVDHELNTPNPTKGRAGTFMAGANYSTAADWVAWPNNGDFATNLTPSPKGLTILNGSTTDIYGQSYADASLAVAVNNSTYRTVYWGFEFSWLAGASSFDDAVNRTLGFFNRSGSLSLASNQLAVSVAFDPIGNDWLPRLSSDWGKPFDHLASAGRPFNATVVVENLGGSRQSNVSVDLAVLDNTTARVLWVQVNFSDVPALTRVARTTALTVYNHGYFTVNATLNRTDSNPADDTDGRAILVPNWQDELGPVPAWTTAGTWRATTAWSYSASTSFAAGVASNANDSLVSPPIDLSSVNATSIAGGARLYFEMSGVIGGGDLVVVEARNLSSGAWVTQQTVSSLNAPSEWRYLPQGVPLSNLANQTGYFRVRFQTGASSTSYLYLDHFMIWTYHERPSLLSPLITVTNASRQEGQPLDFHGSHDNPHNVTNFTYAWDFGDNTTASQRNATHAYPNNGNYLVRFTVDDGAGALETTSLLLAVSNAPPAVASMAGSPAASLEGARVDFTGQCTDPGTVDVLQFVWSFGDGSADANGSAVNHTFANQGNYTVRLTCTDGDGGAASQTLTHSVSNLAPTFVSALVSPTPSNEGQPVNFSGSCADAGSLDILSYSWNFGDGSPNLSGRNVTHTFPDDGNFTITLTCSDGDGGTVASGFPQPVLNVAPAIGAVTGGPEPSDEGSVVGFNGSCSDAGVSDVITYAWDFGDGSQGATGPTASHGYPDDGFYTVVLTCSDADGGRTQGSFVHAVGNVAPSAQVLGSNSTVEGTPVDLGGVVTDVGVLDTFTYLWNFGDGGSASTRNVSHTWRDNGAFPVTLTVTDDDLGSTSVQMVMFVQNAAPSANFSVGGMAAEGALLDFTPAVTDPGAADTFSYLWEFGDAAVSTAAVASHPFANEGAYTVNLTVTDDDGASVLVSQVISVQNLAPRANISASESIGTEGVNASFLLQASDPGANDALRYTVSYGDGSPAVAGPAQGGVTLRHAFPNEGSYTVTVTVEDDGGGVGTASLLFSVENAPPTLFAEASSFVVDEGSTVNFTARVSDLGVFDEVNVTWDLGPGRPPASGLSASRLFAQDGVFEVSATAVDDGGGTTSVTLSIVVRNVAPALSVTLPDPASVLEGTPANFSADARDPGTLDTVVLSWEWGDGSNSTGPQPRHTFADEGNYTVVVTATDSGGAQTTQSFPLVVQNAAPLVVDILVGGTLQEGGVANFSGVLNVVPGESVTLLWSFGDGQTATVLNASHIYGDSGLFTVSLTAADGEGGQSTRTRVVNVTNVAPTLSCQACPGTAVQGQRISIRAHATDAGRNDALSYQLTFPSGTVLTSPDGSFDFVVAEAGQLDLRISADDGDGGTAMISLPIEVKPDFDGDGLEDAVDPDDDNDGAPDLSDPAPQDPAVGGPRVLTPTGGSFGLLLLAAILGAAIILVVARLHKRRRGGA
jgi:PKD repeat protein/subtilisin family serine protease